MEVTLTEKIDLKVLESKFEIVFSITLKKGEKQTYWFTPSGKCKIWIGGLNVTHLGELSDDDYNSLIKQMKDHKCDILTDGRYYFTTGNDKLIKINNCYDILYKANHEWNQRTNGEGWRPLIS